MLPQVTDLRKKLNVHLSIFVQQQLRTHTLPAQTIILTLSNTIIFHLKMNSLTLEDDICFVEEGLTFNLEKVALQMQIVIQTVHARRLIDIRT